VVSSPMMTLSDDIDLTCWYVSLRRVYEKLGLQEGIAIDLSLRDQAPWELPLRGKHAGLRLMRSANVRPLTELLMNGSAAPGMFFTHYGPIRFAWSPEKGRVAPTATATARLNWLSPPVTLQFTISASDLTSSSARGQLRGLCRQLVFGAIQDIAGGVVKAIPYMIGTPVQDLGILGSMPTGDRHNEVFVDDIDSFARVKGVRAPSASQLNKLKEIRERDVKHAFHEILGEGFKESDWGGEHHDLQTTRLIWKGRRVAAVFAFKGPSKFRTLHPKDMGKNGDQIDRLFHESAELYVVQHCHAMAASVRNMMQTYSITFPPRHYMLIDGADTYRVLRAFAKCGLRTPRAQQ